MTEVKEFIKSLDKTCQGGRRSRHDAFLTFLELAYCSLAQRGPCAPERAEELEQRYMRAIEPYKDDEARYEFPKMMALAMMNTKGRDFLGEVAGEGEFLDSRLGQFFTPYQVSRMTAEMTLHDVEGVVAREGYITLQEPACGAGAMILAAADVVEGKGLDVETTMLVNAVDLSDTCYKMAFVQLSNRGVPAQVMRGNTLSLEFDEQAWTPATNVFFAKHGTLFTKTPPPRHRSRPTKEQGA